MFADASGGGERYTFGGLHARASRIADIMYTRYGVRKGDRGMSDNILHKARIKLPNEYSDDSQRQWPYSHATHLISLPHSGDLNFLVQ